jgi:hypothetical protein
MGPKSACSTVLTAQEEAVVVAFHRPAKQPFKRHPIGYFHIDFAEMRTEEGELQLFVAVNRRSPSPSCTRPPASKTPQAS